MRLQLPSIAVCCCAFLVASCLESDDAAKTEQIRTELETANAKLLAQVAELEGTLNQTREELATAVAAAETARGEATTAAEAAGKLAEAEKRMANFRNESARASADYEKNIADLQKQIQAMALKIPTADNPGRPRSPSTQQGQGTIERHVAPR